MQPVSVVYQTCYQTADTPVKALSDIDLRINEGEFVSLIGPSGCGKTTLLRVIADLEQISAGSVLVNGVSPHDARLARAYGYVFQAPALFPWRTVLGNVMLPLQIQGGAGAEAGPSRWSIWSGWGCRGLRANTRGSCRAACSSGCPLPARWRLSPKF
jgi:ABC-type nitrate/sulfonate/bicarbonate transport system ATPase subunit